MQIKRAAQREYRAELRSIIDNEAARIYHVGGTSMQRLERLNLVTRGSGSAHIRTRLFICCLQFRSGGKLIFGMRALMNGNSLVGSYHYHIFLYLATMHTLPLKMGVMQVIFFVICFTFLIKYLY